MKNYQQLCKKSRIDKYTW